LNKEKHIVCVRSTAIYNPEQLSPNQVFSTKDIVISQSNMADNEVDIVKFIPTVVITHKGKVFAFKDASNKTSVAFFRELLISDLALTNGVISLHDTIEAFFSKQFDKYISISSYVVGLRVLNQKVITSEHSYSATKLHHIHAYELEKSDVTLSTEDLNEIGFVSPEALLQEDVTLDKVSSEICKELILETAHSVGKHSTKDTA